jgi:hypothetical protein
MAQNQNKRRRKRRGTQGGSVDTRRRAARPRSREEAKARARSNQKSSARNRQPQKADLPPTWRNSAIRGFGAAVIFSLLLILIFQRPIGASAIFGVAMLVFYIPAGYYIDLALWRKRERQRIREQSR